MGVKEDFAFIIYAATFTCWVVANLTAGLNSDRAISRTPPRLQWWLLFMFGLGVYLAFGVSYL